MRLTMCRAQMLEAIFWQALRHLVLNIGPINCSAAFRLPGKHHIMVHLSFLSYNICYIVYPDERDTRKPSNVHLYMFNLLIIVYTGSNILLCFTSIFFHCYQSYHCCNLSRSFENVKSSWTGYLCNCGDGFGVEWDHVVMGLIIGVHFVIELCCKWAGEE
jgi:hypothetical protein